jgi:F-type H+-transporting ATPase subunit epsilon
MNAFDVSVITPDGVALEDRVDYIVAQAFQGEFTIMAGHVPLVAATRAGVLKAVKQSKERFFAVGESRVEVTREQTLVLANQAEEASDRAEAVKKARQFASDAGRLSSSG